MQITEIRPAINQSINHEFNKRLTYRNKTIDIYTMVRK